MIALLSIPTRVAALGFHFLVLVLLAMAVALSFRPQWWLPLLALFLGLLTGFIDLLSREPQLPALLLLASGFFVSFARPRAAWRWALLIGVWVPAGELARWVLAIETPHSPGSSLLAFVPALLGAYGGVVAARWRSPAHSLDTLKLEAK